MKNIESYRADYYITVEGDKVDLQMLIRGKVHDKFKKQIAVCGLIFDSRVSWLRLKLDFDFDFFYTTGFLIFAEGEMFDRRFCKYM